MFVHAKIWYELNWNASILIISPLKSIFRDHLREMESLGYPTPIASIYRRVLFADVNSKYWLSFSALQFVAKAVMAMPNVTAILVTQSNSAAFLTLRPQLLKCNISKIIDL